jgi:hypothetical protein
LLRRSSLEQRLQLLLHTPLLGGYGLRAAAQQHGCSGQVLGCPPEEWRCVGVGICASIGTSILVGLWHARGRCRCATTRLICSWSAFAPVAVLLAGLALHRNILYRASIVIPLVGLALHQHDLHWMSLAWLSFHVELPV